MERDYADDMTLWAGFQRGENQAEKIVFQKYFKPLCLYSERITVRLEQSEDIVAESFEKAWGRRQEFQTLENLKAFLYRIVRNASINYTIATKQHRTAHAHIEYLTKQEEESET